MKRFFRLSALSAVGLVAITAGCHASQGQDCAPFPAPSLTGASCSGLPGPTELRDLADLEVGGGIESASMTVDDTAIYFVAPGSDGATLSLYRMSKAGGDPQVIDDGVAPPIAVDGATLVYVRLAGTASGALSEPNIDQLGSQCQLQSIPNADGVDSVQQGPIIDGAGGISWTGVGPGTSSEDQSVLHWNPATQATTVVATMPRSGSTLAGDANQLYLLETSAPGGATEIPPGGSFSFTMTILSLPTTGGAPTTLATVANGANLLGMDDDALYVQVVPSVAPSESATTTNVMRIDKTTGATTPLVADTAGAVVAVHDTNIYWVGESTVVRTPKTGGAAETVFSLTDPSDSILGIAFDDCNLYVVVKTFTSTASSYAIWGQALAAPDASAM